MPHFSILAVETATVTHNKFIVWASVHLAAALPTARRGTFVRIPLHEAARHGAIDVARLLLAAAPATATALTTHGSCPLHSAAATRSGGGSAVVELLLHAAPHTARVAAADGSWPLHYVFEPASARLLLSAAPEAAIAANRAGRTPLQCVLLYGLINVAACLLGAAPADSELAALKFNPAHFAHLAPEFAAAHMPLTTALWAQIPTPCPGIGRALPAAVACLPVQAHQVAQRLPEPDRQCLQLAALCLARQQRRLRIWLPGPVVDRILSFLFV